jgi:hypothetical protein
MRIVNKPLIIFASGRSSWMKRLMLYFSISVLINSVAIPTLQRYVYNSTYSNGQINTSLLESVVMNFFGMADDDNELPDTADDMGTSVDYLSVRSRWTITKEYHIQARKIPANYAFPDNPTLEKFIPPPKG